MSAQRSAESGVELPPPLPEASTAGGERMSGLQAIVRTLVEIRRLDRAAGRRTGVFVSGYQGSPLGGLDQELERQRTHLEDLNVIFEPGLNEELAATAVAGTQLLAQVPNHDLDGITGFWFGKNPGLDRAADAVRHANLSGTAASGGVVAWIGDDPGSKSSTVPSSCELMCQSLQVPLLAPGTVADVLALGLHAVHLSRFAGVWVGVKVVADVADSTRSVNVEQVVSTLPRTLPPIADRRPPVLLPPGNLDAEHDLMTRRLELVREYSRMAGLNAVQHEPPSASLAILAAGTHFPAVLRALEILGLDRSDWDHLGIRLVRLGLVWPVDDAELRQLVRGAKTVLVVEDKLPNLETALKAALHDADARCRVVGKTDGSGSELLSPRGAVTADRLAAALAKILGRGEPGDSPAGPPLSRPLLPVLPARTPAFCSGCPHSASTRSSAEDLVGVGIGCHTMVALGSADTSGTVIGMTQMGGEGAQWIGLAPFVRHRHFVQNLGDGTFFHSGSLALRFAVAAGVDVTYRLLMNDVVAMTGGQQAVGRMDLPRLTRWLQEEGVRRVVITTSDPGRLRRRGLSKIASVRRRDEIEQVMAELRETAGVTVLLHVDACATELRRLRRRGTVPTPATRVWINERVCEGCGDCGSKTGCLSLHPVSTPHGRKTRIHQSSCNQDFSCLAGDCPAFVEVSVPGRLAPPRPAVPDTPLPPIAPDREPQRTIRLSGVGGTGVVTVSKILQEAARRDGLQVAALEQVGLAQKGGPVVSDLRIGFEEGEGEIRAAARSVDVVIAFDALGAASPDNTSTYHPESTVVVANTSLTPTSRAVRAVDTPDPAWPEVQERLEASTRATHNVYLDADDLAHRFLGDHMAANLVLVGAAVQAGLLPVSAESVEAVLASGPQQRSDAFRLGRLALARPDLVAATADPAPALMPAAQQLRRDLNVPDVLWDLVGESVDELIRYQSSRYAKRYLTHALRVFTVSQERGGPSHLAVTATYARGLFKLMAYKDEYEVIRLHFDPIERRRLHQEFGPGTRMRLALHPPVLRALGLRHKISFGPWSHPALRLLGAGRRLRGTWLDLFGYAPLRKTERALPDEYVAAVESALTLLTPATAAQVEAICALPDMVRGYETIKSDAITRYRAELRRHLQELAA